MSPPSRSEADGNKSDQVGSFMRIALSYWGFRTICDLHCDTGRGVEFPGAQPGDPEATESLIKGASTLSSTSAPYIHRQPRPLRQVVTAETPTPQDLKNQ